VAHIAAIDVGNWSTIVRKTTAK